MKMFLKDADSNEFTLETFATEGKFLVDGENFGHQKNTYCYLPVFRYGLHNSDGSDAYCINNEDDPVCNTWYAGSLVWDDYTLVLDNSPNDNNAANAYSAMGFGVKNTDLTQNLAAKYTEVNGDYEPVSEYVNLDMSHHTGAWDPQHLVP